MDNTGKLALLEKAAQELIKFINENCSPHDIVIIEQGNVGLYSGVCGFPTGIPD